MLVKLLQKTIFLWFALLLVIYCKHDYGLTPLETDDDLRIVPSIVKIEVTSKNEILIFISREYSSFCKIVLERKSNEEFETIEYNKLSATTLVDTLLERETDHSYIYRIQIVKGKYRGAFSNEKAIHIASVELYAPENFKLVPLEMKGIQLSWLDKSNYEEGYSIQKKIGSGDYQELAKLNKDSTNCLDEIPGVYDPALQLNYKIRAYNTSISSKWIESSINFAGINKPTNLAITNANPNNFQINWVDNSSIETGFILECKKNDGEFQELAHLNANIKEYTLKNMEPGYYIFRVCAVHDNVYSGYSNNRPYELQLLTPGKTISGKIDSMGEKKAYIFNLDANDIFLFQARGDIDTRYELYDPNGNLISQGGNGGWVRYRSGKLSKSGGYILLIMDNGGDEVGVYDFILTKTNRPTQAKEIPLGEVVAGKIDDLQGIAVYTFPLAANDIILFQARGEIHTRYEFYNPDGELLSEGGAGGWVRYRSGKLSKAGMHTLFVMDHDGDNTGSFNLFLTKTNRPTQAKEIPLGEVVAGKIDDLQGIAVYTFPLAANDIILFQARGEIHTRYEFYNPDGELLSEGGAGGWVRCRSGKLSKTGMHTLFIMDHDGDNTGSVDFIVQQVNAPSNSFNLPYGQTVTGKIDKWSDLLTYTFSARLNEVIRFQAIGDVNTYLELYDPNGALVEAGGNGGWLLFNTRQLSTIGMHTFLIMDNGGDDIGSCYLSLQSLINPGNVLSLVKGDSIIVNITQLAEMKTFTYSGSSGEKVEVIMECRSGSLNPRLEIYNPSAKSIFSSQSTSSLKSGPVQLSEEGKYIIMAMDQGGDNTGEFLIRIRQLD